MRNGKDRETRNGKDRGARNANVSTGTHFPIVDAEVLCCLEMWMVMEEDNGTGTHFPLWDAEVLCQAPEVLYQVRDVDQGR